MHHFSKFLSRDRYIMLILKISSLYLKDLLGFLWNQFKLPTSYPHLHLVTWYTSSLKSPLPILSPTYLLYLTKTACNRFSPPICLKPKFTNLLVLFEVDMRCRKCKYSKIHDVSSRGPFLKVERFPTFCPFILARVQAWILTILNFLIIVCSSAIKIYNFTKKALC